MLSFIEAFGPDQKFLETPRLQLRVDTEKDYRTIFGTQPDDFIKEYFGIYTDDALLAQKAKIAGGFTTYRTSVLFIHLIEKATGTVVGSFAYHNWYPAHSRSEIGYAMAAEEYKNKGFMKEAFPAMIAFGFEAMELNRIEAFIHPENSPSRRLVERAGFRKEGLLQEHYNNNGVVGDSMVFGLLKCNYSGTG